MEKTENRIEDMTIPRMKVAALYDALKMHGKRVETLPIGHPARRTYSDVVRAFNEVVREK